jgi:hypothetical protein
MMSLVQWIKTKIGDRMFFEWTKLKPADSSRGAALVANSLRRSRSDPADSGSCKLGCGRQLQWAALGMGAGAPADGLGDGGGGVLRMPVRWPAPAPVETMARRTVSARFAAACSGGARETSRAAWGGLSPWRWRSKVRRGRRRVRVVN